MVTMFIARLDRSWHHFVCGCGVEGPPVVTEREAYLLWETHRLECRLAATAKAPCPAGSSVDAR